MAAVAPSSRICVKQLPRGASESDVRSHFGKRGEVTDVKVLSTKWVCLPNAEWHVYQLPHFAHRVPRTGRARQMAFVGFRTHEQASDAVKHFNKSFMGASKLVVEIAHPVSNLSALAAS